MSARTADAMWRAVAVFRAVAAVEAVLVTTSGRSRYERPWAALGVAATYGAWAVLVTLVERRGRRWVVATDVVVTAAVTVATLAVASHAAVASQVPTLAVAGLAGPVLAAALVAGAPGGLAAAAVVAAADLGVHLQATGRGPGLATLTGTATVLLFAGGIGGHLAAAAQRAEAQAVAATAEAEAARARNDLAAGVHDDVLQSLAMLARDAARLPAADVAALAGHAERALRTHLQGLPQGEGTDLLRAVADVVVRRPGPPEVVLALPAIAAPRPAHLVAAVTGAMTAALDNVARHAPASKAYVGAAPEGDRLALWVRDEGPGIADGRLAEAERDGRLGVSRSIVGRLEAAGAAVTVHTGDHGTEVAISA